MSSYPDVSSLSVRSRIFFPLPNRKKNQQYFK